MTKITATVLQADDIGAAAVLLDDIQHLVADFIADHSLDPIVGAVVVAAALRGVKDIAGICACMDCSLVIDEYAHILLERWRLFDPADVPVIKK